MLLSQRRTTDLVATNALLRPKWTHLSLAVPCWPGMDETQLLSASWAGLQTCRQRERRCVASRLQRVIGCLAVWMRTSLTRQDANHSEVLNMLRAKSSGIGVELCRQNANDILSTLSRANERMEILIPGVDRVYHAEGGKTQTELCYFELFPPVSKSTSIFYVLIWTQHVCLICSHLRQVAKPHVGQHIIFCLHDGSVKVVWLAGMSLMTLLIYLWLSMFFFYGGMHVWAL